jgi:hypothetical protein
MDPDRDPPFHSDADPDPTFVSDADSNRLSKLMRIPVDPDPDLQH